MGLWYGLVTILHGLVGTYMDGRIGLNLTTKRSTIVYLIAYKYMPRKADYFIYTEQNRNSTTLSILVQPYLLCVTINNKIDRRDHCIPFLL